MSEKSINSQPRRDSRSSKDMKAFFRAKDKLASSRSKDGLHDLKKSKSKSVKYKIRDHNSKSHNNLKSSSHTETFE